VEHLLAISIFLIFGFAFIFGALLFGYIVRPSAPNPEKKAVYECGEPTIGSGWVQFDLRFYVVALFYLVFDVEVALMYPWAVVFREYALEALVLGAPFMAVIIVGYAYEWYSGSLDWIRSSVMTTRTRPAGMTIIGAPAGSDLSRLAKTDPESLDI
jgi:NADH-quinone oxidoreductase subunit A